MSGKSYSFALIYLLVLAIMEAGIYITYQVMIETTAGLFLPAGYRIWVINGRLD